MRRINTLTLFFINIIILCFSGISLAFSEDSNEKYIDSIQTQSKSYEGEKKLNFLTSVCTINLRRNYPISMYFANNLLLEAEKQNSNYYQARACHILGEVYRVLDDSTKTLHYFTKCLYFATKTDSFSFIGIAYNALGTAYQKINTQESLSYFLKALNIQRKTNNYVEIRKVYNNIGVLYERNDNDLNNALTYYQNALGIAKLHADSVGIAVAKINIGDVYRKLGLYIQSEKYLNEAFYIVNRLNLSYLKEQLSRSLSMLYEKSGRYYSAYPQLKKYYEYKIARIEECSRLNLQELEMKYQVNEKTKEIATLNTQGTKQKILLIMFFVISIVVAIFSILLAYQMRRFKQTNLLLKEGNKEIEAQKIELEKKNIELKELSAVASETDNAIIIANGDGIIQYVNDSFIKLTGATYEDLHDCGLESIYALSSNVNLKEAVAEAVKIKQSITVENQTVTIKGREQFGQTTITPIFDENDKLIRILFIDTDITKLKVIERELFSRQQELTTSIRYARRLQKELLPPFKSLSCYFSDFLLFVRPKDIVSGDFYWMKEIDSKLYIAMADCTGHGVPGAFMSVLSIALVNDVFSSIYREDKMVEPGKFLDELRIRVKDMLNQNTEESGLQDGMDISFLCIDRVTQILTYAGAYSSMAIIRKTENGYENFPLKGDRMPVGVHPRCNPFNSIHFQLEPDDRCYLFTDGYMIQPGGPKHKKISRKQFINLLISIQDRNMESQWLALKLFLRNWIKASVDSGEYIEQIDDITILGFQLRPFQS